MHIPAPRESLPGHSESYNPPEEYLFDKEEVNGVIDSSYLFRFNWSGFRAFTWECRDGSSSLDQ